MSDLIAVTGPTGVVGGRVARRLAHLGVALRLVVRDPARAPELPGAEVRVSSAYGAGEEMRAALAGVATLFLVPAHESADRVAQHRTAVDAAVAAGVQRIVYLSFSRSPTSSARTRIAWITSRLQTFVQLPTRLSSARSTGSPRHRIRRAPEKGGPHDADPLPALSATLVR
jgi:NAD(P)H dehydrogenase (quinone)